MKKSLNVSAVLAALGATLIAGPSTVSADSVIESLCFGVDADPGDTALVNLTPVAAHASGFGRLTTSPIPLGGGISNVNFGPGTVDPNVGLAAVGADGQVCFGNGSPGRVHLVADHLGTIEASDFEPASLSGAQRVVDTRADLGGSRIGPGGRLCFAVAGSPGDGAIVNLTPVRPGAAGNGQLVSSDLVSPPVASNVNYRPGVIDPNVAVAPIGAGGDVCFVNADIAAVHLVADHLGTISASAYSPASPGGAPLRVADTRSGVGGGRLAPGAASCFAVSGDPGDAAIVNLTPVLARGSGNGSLLPSPASTRPTVSNVNYRVGSTDPNVAISSIGADGRVCFTNDAAASVDLVADHLGTIDAAAYTPATVSGEPSRRVDTRTTASRADLVLAANGVGYAAHRRNDASAIAYVESGLGPAVSDERRSYPVDAGDTELRWETADGQFAFTWPESREVGFDNGLLLIFGGPTQSDLRLVGWSQSSFLVVADMRIDAVTAPLRTAVGITIGSRGSDHPGSINVGRGGCYSVGGGTTNGISLDLRSDGVPFLEVEPGGVFSLNTPPLSDVVVEGLSSGEFIAFLEGDC